jgi:U3 small nucleolar RNA-associated protein 14
VHGKPLLPGPIEEKRKKVNRKRRGAGLDAFAIAEGQVKDKSKGLRRRDLEPEIEKKRRRYENDEGDDEDDDSDADSPKLKRQRREEVDKESDVEYLSDSEGHEWRIGVGGDDEDSEIDSDDAFGEGDEQRFGDVGKTSSQKARNAGDEGDIDLDEDEDDDSDSLGEDAIDLAQALDENSEDEDSDGDDGSESDVDDFSSGPSEVDEDGESESGKLDALQDLVMSLSKGGKGDDDNIIPSSTGKITLEDLGLSGVKDANIKKSLKLMQKEEKAKPGSSKRLDVPLARRQQDRISRMAASEKANETLNRWTDTVAHNRRAEHLMFPLPENLANAGLDNSELHPLTRKTAGTELEQTIMSIMEESGLGPSSKPKEEALKEVEPMQAISRANVLERRRDREIQSREQARAKRIKKIKSKSYRRVHRKQSLRDLEREEGLEDGDMDSEEEREEEHRRRALERMGGRVRESKWAKLGKKTGRAVWDDDFRQSLNEKGKREADLRRRIEGRGDNSDDDMSGGSASEDEDDMQRLRRELEAADVMADASPPTGIYSHAFMIKAEEKQKKANDELIAQMRKALDSDAEDSGSGSEEVDIGRRSFGPSIAEQMDGSTATAVSRKPASSSRTKPISHQKEDDEEPIIGGSWGTAPAHDPNTSGAWEVADGKSKQRKNKRPGRDVASLDITAIALPSTSKPTPAEVSRPQPPANPAIDKHDAPDSSDSDSDAEAGTDGRPLRLKLSKAAAAAVFGADDDVEASFAREKAEMETEQDDRVIDNTLPGWGSWTGSGVSKREERRGKRALQTVVKGVAKADRRDAKLERVIVSEKRTKKVRDSLRRGRLGRRNTIKGKNTDRRDRTTSTSPPRSRTSSRPSSSTSARCACPSGRNGRPRRRSRTRRSRASLSSRASLRRCRGLCCGDGVEIRSLIVWNITWPPLLHQSLSESSGILRCLAKDYYLVGVLCIERLNSVKCT